MGLVGVEPMFFILCASFLSFYHADAQGVFHQRTYSSQDLLRNIVDNSVGLIHIYKKYDKQYPVIQTPQAF